MSLQDVQQLFLNTRSQIQDEAASLSAGQTRLQADVAKLQADVAKLQADVQALAAR